MPIKLDMKKKAVPTEKLKKKVKLQTSKAFLNSKDGFCDPSSVPACMPYVYSDCLSNKHDRIGIW